jgi:GWxTD domain-containing protein
MLAWAYVRPRVKGGVPTTQPNIQLMARVDSSLRLAAHQAPDSARYQIDLGRFFLHANVITMRVQAPERFNKAVAAARRVGDSTLVAEALDELGMVYWRRYEAVAHRRILTGGITRVAADQLLDHPKNAENLLANHTVEPVEWSGQLDYLNATVQFGAAQRANPRSARVARHIFMSLADRSNWEELESATELRLAADSTDAIAWLTRGLAFHRLNAATEAEGAFTRALELLPAQERARYTDISRLMKPADSTAYVRATEAARTETNRMYWSLGDPLVLTRVNEGLLEFLSRITYADLQWTSDDLDHRGADSDRGQIYIRYGPPPTIASFAPDPAFGTILWYYPAEKMSFVFRSAPSYGTATVDIDYRAVVEDTRYVVPASFRNLDLVRLLDTIPVQLSRFRSESDSTDLLVLAEIPLRRMTVNTDLASGVLDVALATYSDKARPIAWDSSRRVLRFSDTQPVEKRAWRQRYAPATIVYRLEALQPDAMRGARAMGSIDMATRRGYGLSDLVVAERVVPRDSATSNRWSDMLIVPSANTLRRGESFGLLWETYDLAQRSGNSRYAVDISMTVLELDRTPEGGEQPSRGEAMVTNIIGGIADAIGLSAKGDERVSLKYTRQHDARAVALNYLTIELGDAPRGRYRLRVEVTDLVSNQRATAERMLTVVR